jgi:archaellum component FlaC
MNPTLKQMESMRVQFHLLMSELSTLTESLNNLETSYKELKQERDEALEEINYLQSNQKEEA